MPQVSVETFGLDGVMRELAKLDRLTERRALFGGLRAGAKVLIDGITENAPRRSGRLAKKSSWGRRPAGGMADPTMLVYLRKGKSRAFYGKFIEFGAGAHAIKVKNRKAMAGGLSHPVRRPISHPGTAPRPFVRPALDSRRGAIQEAIAQAMRQQLVGAGVLDDGGDDTE